MEMHTIAASCASLDTEQQQVREFGMGETGWSGGSSAVGIGFCAICLERIPVQDVALVKGCDHAYCVQCILRWVTYSKKPSCPQCKHPFESLSLHRSLDGCVHEFLFEESVCLLLRATWFVPLSVEAEEVPHDEHEDLVQYYDDAGEEDDLDEAYFMSSSSGIRIGNRRWGNSGYVRAGRREARPMNRNFFDDADLDAGPSRDQHKKKAAPNATGRRAKRALKREAADKAAATKHQQTSAELGARLDRFSL